MKRILILLSLLLLLGEVYAQEDAMRRHSVLVYPTRMMNYYFPVVSLGYQYHSLSSWSGGVSIGAVSAFQYSRNNKFTPFKGFDLGFEGRYNFGGGYENPWGAFLGLEFSRAYAERPWGIERTEVEGVGKLVNTKVVARRDEINFGISKTWQLMNGLVFDIRLGGGVNAYCWKVADNDILAAPKEFSIFDEDGHYGLRNGQAKEHEIYFAPRVRIGLGWCF